VRGIRKCGKGWKWRKEREFRCRCSVCRIGRSPDAPDPQGSEARGLPNTIERFEDGSDVARFSSQLPYAKDTSDSCVTDCWLLVTFPPPPLPRGWISALHHIVPHACICQSLYPFTGPRGTLGLANNYNPVTINDTRLWSASCAGDRDKHAEEARKGNHRSLRLTHRPMLRQVTSAYTSYSRRQLLTVYPFRSRWITWQVHVATPEVA